MAITKARTVQRLEVYPATDSTAENTTNEGNPSVMVNYFHTFDDSSDDTLPVTTESVKHIYRFTNTGSEGEATPATDVTGEDQLVQDVCAAIWPTE